MIINHELPKDFYLPEYRDGFYVNENRKKIWAVELDLLKKFADVCEKHDLQYFMDGGTLLGAIRHKGFIPWDDDVDVIMPRKDYNRLIEIAEDEFKDPYFFQTSLTTDGFFRTHVQIRNTSTTGFIVADAAKKDVKKGIWLDVFALDNVADGLLAKKLQKEKIQRVKTLLKRKYDIESTAFSRAFYNVFSFETLFKYFDRKVLGAYEKKNTKWVGDLTLQWRNRCMWPVSYYDGYCYLDFENIKLRAPIFYNEVMKRQYGKKYMDFPEGYLEFPVEPGAGGTGATHGSTIFDTDTPCAEFDFTPYIKKKK